MDKEYTPLLNDRNIRVKLVWLNGTKSIYTVIDRVPTIEGSTEFFAQEFGRWHISIPELQSLHVMYENTETKIDVFPFYADNSSNTTDNKEVI